MIFVLSASENGRASLQKQEKLPTLLIDLLCSSDSKSSKLCCLIFDQLLTIPIYLEVIAI